MRDGVRLWYEVEGPGDGVDAPTVVLVPGRGDSSDLFPADLSEDLVRARRRVVRFDPRDTGRSDDGGDAYTMSTMADDAVAVLDHALGIAASDADGATGALAASPANPTIATGVRERAVHWIGVSMAGLHLVDLGLRHADRVASLTFVAAISPDPDGGFGDRFFADLPADPVETYLISMGEVSDTDVEWTRRHVARGDRRAAPRPRASEAHMEAVYRSTWPTLHDLTLIAAPTMVVHGTVDRTVPVAHAHALADGIAGARLTLVDGMGHLPRPDDWAMIARESPATDRTDDR